MASSEEKRSLQKGSFSQKSRFLWEAFASCGSWSPSSINRATMFAYWVGLLALPLCVGLFSGADDPTRYVPSLPVSPYPFIASVFISKDVRLYFWIVQGGNLCIVRETDKISPLKREEYWEFVSLKRFEPVSSAWKVAFRHFAIRGRFSDFCDPAKRIGKIIFSLLHLSVHPFSPSLPSLVLPTHPPVPPLFALVWRVAAAECWLWAARSLPSV